MHCRACLSRFREGLGTRLVGGGQCRFVIKRCLYVAPRVCTLVLFIFGIDNVSCGEFTSDCAISIAYSLSLRILIYFMKIGPLARFSRFWGTL